MSLNSGRVSYWIILIFMVASSGLLDRIVGGKVFLGDLATGITIHQNPFPFALRAISSFLLIFLIASITYTHNIANLRARDFFLYAYSAICFISTITQPDHITTQSIIDLYLIFAVSSIFLLTPTMKIAGSLVIATRDFLLIALSTTAILAVALPGFSFHQTHGDVYYMHAGLLRGLLIHKNDTGLLFGAACLFFLYYGPQSMKLRSALIASATSFLFVIMSGSLKIMIFVPMAIVTHYFFFGSLFRREFRFLTLLICATLTVSVISLGPSTFLSTPLELLGRDETMSSRTLIWPVIFNSMTNHEFIIGLGVANGWHMLGSDAVYFALGSFIGHPHNGYISIILDSGAISLIAFLAWGILELRSALAVKSQKQQPHSETCIDRATKTGFTILVFCLLVNFLGTHTFSSTPWIWVMCLALLGAGRLNRE